MQGVEVGQIRIQNKGSKGDFGREFEWIKNLESFPTGTVDSILLSDFDPYMRQTENILCSFLHFPFSPPPGGGACARNKDFEAYNMGPL